MAAAYIEQYDKLDVLINNAGLMVDAYQTTEEGFEMQIGVNHLGHFLLTSLLIPTLEKGVKPRIVNVSSVAHYSGRIDFDRFTQNKGNYKGMAAYSASKLANVLFTNELAKKYPHIDSNSLHPGVVSTGIGNKNASGFVSIVWSLIKPFAKSKSNGAKTSIYLASDPSVEGKSGLYFHSDQKVKQASDSALDTDLAKKLWEYSEKAIKEN